MSWGDLLRDIAGMAAAVLCISSIAIWSTYLTI